MGGVGFDDVGEVEFEGFDVRGVGRGLRDAFEDVEDDARETGGGEEDFLGVGDLADLAVVEEG